jgi:hypothetical protein
MARLVVRTLDVSKPLVARRKFVASGRRFNPGDLFPWKALGISARQVGLLFNTGNVVHPTMVPAPVTPAPTVEMEMQDADTHHVAVTANDDGLDGLNLKDLRQIAVDEGAPTRVSRDEQREAIRAHRIATAEAASPKEGTLDA